jgi:hypothetical protein
MIQKTERPFLYKLPYISSHISFTLSLPRSYTFDHMKFSMTLRAPFPYVFWYQAKSFGTDNFLTLQYTI